MANRNATRHPLLPIRYSYSKFLHLSHLEFHLRRAAEDGDRDLEPRTLVIDFLDHAVEGGERPLAHPHLLAHLEGDRRPHTLSTLLLSSSTALGLPIVERPSLGVGPQ